MPFVNLSPAGMSVKSSAFASIRTDLRSGWDWLATLVAPIRLSVKPSLTPWAIGPLVLPAYFVLANLAAALAFYQFMRGERYASWEPIREDKDLTLGSPALVPRASLQRSTSDQAVTGTHPSGATSTRTR